MLDRQAHGSLPPKHHTRLTEGASLRYEHCITRGGFEGGYTICYHVNRPQAWRATSEVVRYAGASSERTLTRRHFRTQALATTPSAVAERQGLLGGDGLRLSAVRMSSSDQAYSLDASADELIYCLSGAATLRTILGDVAFKSGDYVLLPKGLLYRLLLDTSEAHLLSLRLSGGIGIPKRFRTDAGQLRMDAPYCHRDFSRPLFTGPRDEGIREVWVWSDGYRQKFVAPHSPLDVVGWDGAVYPLAFPILAFQPRVASVHLPPTWHATFDAPGVVVCSFVPRPLDFGPDAISCPFVHTSVDMDEVLFYVSGSFASRTGVGAGSVTHHPAGVPHGPHPGRYEASVGQTHTTELAVMLDCRQPLSPLPHALSVEDATYEATFQS